MLRATGSNTKEELAGGTLGYATDETEGEDSSRAGTGEFWINVCKAEDAAHEMTGWNVDEIEEFWTRYAWQWWWRLTISQMWQA